jgi:hypothetical protein
MILLKLQQQKKTIFPLKTQKQRCFLLKKATSNNYEKKRTKNAIYNFCTKVKRIILIQQA